jgi:replicative DNA helicase
MVEQQNSGKITFGQYGKSFQEKIMQAMLNDSRWSEQMLEVIDVSYFDLKYLQFLADRYFSYAKKYKVFPTFDLLITIIRDDLKTGTDAVLREQIIEYLQRVRLNPSPGDIAFVKEKSLDFCRKQALKKAFVSGIEMMETEKYESIVDLMKNAVSVGTTPSLGHDFFEDFDARFMQITRRCVPTGIAELDKKTIFDGGLGAGELGCVIAATGVGKSHFLTMLGANALRNKKNVMHYTFELSEAKTGIRYDSNLCDIESNDVVDNKDSLREKYSKMSGELGKLKIKFYPSGSATVHMLRTHIEKLNLKGFVPDIILIDYADIMKSSRSYDSLRHELKLVYTELRGMAEELQVPIWTASQSNKEGSQADIIDLGNMAEAYGKAFVADVVISLSRKSYEKASGWGRMYIAKNRAGRDGLVYPIKIDTARSTFLVSGPTDSVENAVQQGQDETKKKLLAKLRELDHEGITKKN